MSGSTIERPAIAERPASVSGRIGPGGASLNAACPRVCLNSARRREPDGGVPPEEAAANLHPGKQSAEGSSDLRVRVGRVRGGGSHVLWECRSTPQVEDQADQRVHQQGDDFEPPPPSVGPRDSS